MNGNRLKQLRKKRGLTLKQVSKEVGFSGDRLGKYERNEREPNITTWEALAKFFKVTPQYLVGWTDEPH
ncbi:helix-turn-helix domain-containing protein [Fructobacillus tropaeoli]|uniref:helix-turn-helix domain-containing protein n=1 Tax=Fructobacillus tropaeoli TaxID=709323 RepID=UPI0019429477|nr:helix-turn-helix transcriptional regulator [Fructobacillus tropaeoli]GIC69598.1 helix-turn-helix transcriptional regulator [Fructobacillus tropaeoli]